jgi:hypothetical protein
MQDIDFLMSKITRLVFFNFINRGALMNFSDKVSLILEYRGAAPRKIIYRTTGVRISKHVDSENNSYVIKRLEGWC